MRTSSQVGFFQLGLRVGLPDDRSRSRDTRIGARSFRRPPADCLVLSRSARPSRHREITLGFTMSIWRNRYGTHAAISSNCGSGSRAAAFHHVADEDPPRGSSIAPRILVSSSPAVRRTVVRFVLHPPWPLAHHHQAGLRRPFPGRCAGDPRTAGTWCSPPRAARSPRARSLAAPGRSRTDRRRGIVGDAGGGSASRLGRCGLGFPRAQARRARSGAIRRMTGSPPEQSAAVPGSRAPVPAVAHVRARSPRRGFVPPRRAWEAAGAQSAPRPSDDRDADSCSLRIPARARARSFKTHEIEDLILQLLPGLGNAVPAGLEREPHDHGTLGRGERGEGVGASPRGSTVSAPVGTGPLGGARLGRTIVRRAAP